MVLPIEIVIFNDDGVRFADRGTGGSFANAGMCGPWYMRYTLSVATPSSYGYEECSGNGDTVKEAIGNLPAEPVDIRERAISALTKHGVR